MVMKAIINDGMPIPNPTPIAILSDCFIPPAGLSSLLSGAAVVWCVIVISDAVVVCRVLVSVALLLVLSCNAVVIRNSQVNAEVQYAPTAQHAILQQALTEEHVQLELGQQIKLGSYRAISVWGNNNTIRPTKGT